MVRFPFYFGACLLWLSPSPCAAEHERVIASHRVLLADLVPEVPADVAELDMGPAPAVGSSRLYSREELAAALRQSGHVLSVNDSVRAVRATRRWSQADLLSLLEPSVRAALPGFATLVRLDVPRSLLTASNVELTRIELGQLPNRQGNATTSAVAELSVAGRIEHRVTLPLVVRLEERPKPAEVERGSSVTLVVNLGSAKVSALATTLQPIAVGNIGLFRVVKTRKTLRAKLVSTSTAEVVSE